MYNQTKFDKSFDTPFFRDPEGYMKRKRRNMILMIVGVFSLMIIAYATFITKAHSKGKSFYTIELYTYGGGIHQYQSDSIISQTPNTVKFIDIFGREQVVTGENIVVTRY